MTPAELVPLLHDYHLGRLDRPRHAEVEAALAASSELRELSRTYWLLSAVIREQARTADHPSADEIVQLALGPDQIDDESQARLSQHLDSCQSCADQLNRTRQAAASIRQRPQLGGTGPAPVRSGFRGGGLLAAVAAVLLAAVLAYPAYVGLVRYPAARNEAAALAEQLAGPVDLQLLVSGARDGAELPVVELAADQPYVALGIDVDIPPRLADTDMLRIETSMADGSPVLLGELTAARARQQIAAAGVVTLLVPRVSLEPGRQTLRVFQPDAPEPWSLAQIVFEIVAP